MARSKTEAAASKVQSAVALGGLGASLGTAVAPGVGTAIGGSVGAITGLIIGDGETIFPLDMVAIPAYQAYMINGAPSLQVYIRAGETLMPTGGNVEDVQNSNLKQKKPKRSPNPPIVREFFPSMQHLNF